MLVAVDVEGSDVWGTTNEMNFYLFGWTAFGRHGPAGISTTRRNAAFDWWRNGIYSVNGTCFDIGSTVSGGLGRFQRAATLRDFPSCESFRSFGEA